MRTTTLPRPSASATGTCPACGGTFETCRCTGVAPLGGPRAGVADDIRREDDLGGHDGRGYERDETDRFHRLVRQLTDEGDDLAVAAGRRARRTLQEMLPGYVRQPVLILHRPVMGEQCPLGVTALSEQERKELSDKVRDANKRSESRPK
ncbi:hypothetical protein ACF058_27435 [Streptomyces sp. NPDC015501]|uniref:hypothetical protein n=1 Tax=unclassified Streptomyces TaxID=2593676 RepID=UPI003702B004